MAVQGPEHETDHSAQGLSELLAEYVPADRLRDFLDILLNGEATTPPIPPRGVQSAEDVLWQLYTERGLIEIEGGGPAVGEQLDVIGRIVGQERLDVFGGSDDIYRAILLVRIKINVGTGSPSEILDILDEIQTVAGGTSPIRILEHFGKYDASFYTLLGSAFSTELPGIPSLTWAEAIWQIVQDAKPAGVQWHFLWSTYEADDLFTLSSQLAAVESDADMGYGNLNIPPTAGGRIMGMVP